MAEIRPERDDDADSIRTEVLNAEDEDSYDLEGLIDRLTEPAGIGEVPVSLTTDEDLFMFDENAQSVVPQQRGSCSGSTSAQDYEATTITCKFFSLNPHSHQFSRRNF